MGGQVAIMVLLATRRRYRADPHHLSENLESLCRIGARQLADRLAALPYALIDRALGTAGAYPLTATWHVLILRLN